MKKLLIFIFLVMITFAVSYLFSEPLYRFYIKSYHHFILRESYEESLKKSNFYLEKRGEESYFTYLKKMIIIYPDGKEFHRLLGELYLKRSKPDLALLHLGKSLEYKNSDYDALSQMARIMLKELLYADLKSLLANYDLTDNRELLLYKLIAQYYTEDYKEARISAGILIKADYQRKELYYYAGMVEDKFGNLKEALNYLERAYQYDTKDKKIRRSLVKLYRKAKMYQEAARLIRARFE